MQTLLLFCHYEIRERYFGFLLRSLNALLIQNRHSLVGWEASFLKLPTPESWKKVNFMPCYLIRTSTGKNFIWLYNTLFTVIFRKTAKIERLPARVAILVSYVKKCTEGANVGINSGGVGREASYQTVPCPLSRIDTHPRWQPVTQSIRCRQSNGKNRGMRTV